MKSHTAALLVAGTTLVAGACSHVPSRRASFREPTGVAHFALSATDLDLLTVRGGAADVTIVGGAGDSVIADVSLRSHDARRLAETCLPRTRLVDERDGGRLTLRLDPGSRDSCGEVWHVQVPARLAVHVGIAVGKLSASGIGGGFSGRVSGTGDIRATVDGGTVDATVNVGDVHVTSTAGDYRRVMLEANVGKVELETGGMRIPIPRVGAGARLETTGRGTHDVRLESSVGNVTLVLAPRA